MSIAVTSHLNFRGQARAALNFYESVFGGAYDASTAINPNTARPLGCALVSGPYFLLSGVIASLILAALG